MDFLELVKSRYSCRAYKLFSLPGNEEPAVIIPLGYADDEPKEKKRKPIEDIIT